MLKNKLFFSNKNKHIELKIMKICFYTENCIMHLFELSQLTIVTYAF